MKYIVDISSVKLETERLILRPFEVKDLEDFFEYASVEGVGECAGWNHHENIEVSKDILTDFIRERKTFALVYKENNKVIGSLGLEESKEDIYKLNPFASFVELGYVLSKDYWGKGLMTEASKRVIEFIFSDLGVDYITVCHFVENDRSRRVIEKLGFKYVCEDVFKTREGREITSLYYLLKNPNAKKETNIGINRAFDNSSSPKFSPLNFYKKPEVKFDKIIITYSFRIIDELLEDGIIYKDDFYISASSGIINIYHFVDNPNNGIVLSSIGGPFVSAITVELSDLVSCKKFIMFGSAGSLTKYEHPFLIPTKAYRDEGISYHYMATSDFIEVSNASKVCKVFSELGIKYETGYTWTTDSFYTETTNKIEDRISRGCKAVEMEIASLQATANYHGFELYCFVYLADHLENEEYDRGLLTNNQVKGRELSIFLSIAKKLMEKI